MTLQSNDGDGGSSGGGDGDGDGSDGDDSCGDGSNKRQIQIGERVTALPTELSDMQTYRHLGMKMETGPFLWRSTRQTRVDSYFALSPYYVPTQFSR